VVDSAASASAAAAGGARWDDSPLVALGPAAAAALAAGTSAARRLAPLVLLDVDFPAFAHGMVSNGPSTPSSSPSYSFGPIAIAPDQVFYETETAVALVNIKPVFPGHVLVISRRRCPRFTALGADEVSGLWLAAHEVGRRLEAHYRATALTVAIQDGPDAGQSVPHVHVHILPRQPLDLPDNDEVYKILDANGAGGHAHAQSHEEGGALTRGVALDPLVAGRGGAVPGEGALGESAPSPVSRQLVGGMPIGALPPAQATAAAAAAAAPSFVPRGPRSMEDMAAEARAYRLLFPPPAGPVLPPAVRVVEVGE
jgi:bis(5'-adenosyl)-triphosphatase